MGYDLWFKNMPNEHRKHLADGAMGFVDRQEIDDPVERMNAWYDALRQTGFAERASVHVMHALCEELRAQGAKTLADDLIAWTDLSPQAILDGLRGVSVIPTGPPDHEYVAPFESDHAALVEAGAVISTARHDLATLDEAGWAYIWSRFIAFLVRAAAMGDGVAVE